MKIALSEVIKEVAVKTGRTQVETKEVVNAFLSEVKDNLMVGNDVPLNGIGVLRIAEVGARPEREGIVNPAKGEKGILPATPAYDTVRFKMSAPFKNEMKDKTAK